jgi:hypothetical protein
MCVNWVIAGGGGGFTQVSRPSPDPQVQRIKRVVRAVKSEKRTTNDERPTTAPYSVRLNSGTAAASVTTAKIDR